MKLYDLIKIYNLNIESNKIRVVRHQRTKRPWVDELMKAGLFDLYQATQQSDKFKDADYLISFTELPHNRALFQGIYRINNNGLTDTFPPELYDFIWEQEKWDPQHIYTYAIEKLDTMAELKHRLIIGWSGPRQWVQINLNFEVIEILPTGYYKPFTGYQNVLLTFDELETLINNPIANKEWKDMLSGVLGIYVILDTVDWKQYIGKASGKEGIWGRWSDYARSPHDGDDIALTKLLQEYPDRYKYFQFSILTVLPKETLEEEVLQVEKLTKKKLGTRENGYNRN